MRWRLGTLGNVVEMGTKMILRVIRSPLISSRAFTGDELVTFCHLELEGSGTTSNNSFCPRAWNTGYTIRIKTIYGSNLIFGDWSKNSVGRMLKTCNRQFAIASPGKSLGKVPPKRPSLWSSISATNMHMPQQQALISVGSNPRLHAELNVENKNSKDQT